MKRVLLIEDNPIEARLLRADFQRTAPAEFEIFSVPRLDEAFVTLQQATFDVILLDLFLEDTSGLETLTRVRKKAPDLPIVVLTGLKDEDVALKALENGAQDYLIKGSVDIEVLRRTIRYAIGRKQAESERRRLEQRLVQNQKLEAVGTLAGGVAHNFNNSLTVVLGRSKLLLEGMSSTDPARAHVESIIRSSEKAATLIRQLLTFSRKRTAESVPVKLNQLILDMQMLIESTFDKSAGVELRLNAQCDVIKGNPGQVGQVLMNLAMNARNAMTSSGKFTIETSNIARGQVLLTVRDTGCGMSPEICAQVFEPFFTTKSLAEASGLGLSTAYGIIKQHGGDVQISSVPGEGTAVSIVFPTLDAFASETKATRHLTILIVHHPETFADSCFDGLEKTPEYAVIKANSFHEALDVVDAHNASVDLLIADAATPGFLRPHLLKQLAGERPEMKIVFVSDPRTTQESLLQSVTEALRDPRAPHTEARALACVAGS